MTPTARPAWLVFLVFLLAGTGCEQVSDNNPAGTNPSPAAGNLKPEVSTTTTTTTGPVDSKLARAPSNESLPANTNPDTPTEKASESAAPEKKEGPGVSTSAGDVTLKKVKYDDFRKQVAAGAKFTVVDCWATWCAPCKENFPHVVEMNKKYGGKGLAVISLSFDDPANAQQIRDAEKFLKEKNATFTNLLLDEGELGGFDKFDISAIPAVFVYGPDGKELKRFTLDDPNNQFTYDEVEKTLVALLDGKPLPETLKVAKPAQDQSKTSK